MLCHIHRHGRPIKVCAQVLVHFVTASVAKPVMDKVEAVMPEFFQNT